MILAWLLNIAGLLISTYSAVLMCRFPMQPPRFDAAGQRIVGGEDSADAATKLNYARYSFWSQWALYLLVIGFALQLAGTFLAFMERFWI